jgi:hypothetical protein
LRQLEIGVWVPAWGGFSGSIRPFDRLRTTRCIPWKLWSSTKNLLKFRDSRADTVKASEERTGKVTSGDMATVLHNLLNFSPSTVSKVVDENGDPPNFSRRDTLELIEVWREGVLQKLFEFQDDRPST